MIIRCRPMRPRDVSGAVALVASHRIARRRYGDNLNQLGSTWLRVLDQKAFCPIVFEELHAGRARMIGGAASVFVNDDFLRDVKTPPFFWIGPELANRIAGSKSPLLSDTEVAAANASGGLNLLLWHMSIDPEEAKREDVRMQVSAAFFDCHRGFLLKELIALQASFPEEVDWIVQGGGLLFDPVAACYGDIVGKAAPESFAVPHIFGITRELALRNMSWISSLFLYNPPLVGFSPSEQRLLSAALRGATDDELSDELAISLSAVKKAWCSVYDRAGEYLPESILNYDDSGDRSERDRGKQKKQRLLAYLREHPEELRPYRKQRDQTKALLRRLHASPR
jgi:hypothetical protein